MPENQRETAPKISAVVLVKNHRQFIRGCLETLAWADEIVVLNDNSTDGSLDIARQFPNVLIFDHALGNNWTAHRNFGIEKATGDWVFQVDVDHRISPALASEIRQKTANTTHNAFGLRYWATVLGRIFGDDEGETYNPLLVRKGKGFFGSDNETHCRMQVQGTIGKIAEPVIHLGPYLSSTSFFQKNAFFAETEARSNIRRDTKIPSNNPALTLWWAIGKPVLVFLQKYLVRGFWKRGASGFHYSLLRAIGYYMVYLRTWELFHIEKQGCNELLNYCKEHGLPTMEP